MSLSVDNCKVVYFSLVFLDNEIVNLTAKVKEGKTLVIWVKPSNPEALSAYCKNQGEIFTGSEIIRGNTRIPTVPLRQALFMFRDFLAASPKPALLVSHSADMLNEILIRAILQTQTKNIFRGIVAGFSDSMIDFRFRFPNRNQFQDLTLRALARDILGDAEWNYTCLLSVRYLELLVTTCRIPTSAFFDHGLPYEIALDLYNCQDYYCQD